MVLGIQIIGTLFGIFMLYYSYIRFKRREFTRTEFTFWFITWVAFVLITLFPRFIDPISVVGGFHRPLDVYIVAGFMFLIGITFYTYTLTRQNQKQIERVVRRIALEKKKRK